MFELCAVYATVLQHTQHPLVLLVLALGSLVLSVGVVGWTLSGARRRAAAQQARRQAYAKAANSVPASHGPALQCEGCGVGSELDTQQQQRQPLDRQPVACTACCWQHCTPPGQQQPTEEAPTNPLATSATAAVAAAGSSAAVGCHLQPTTAAGPTQRATACRCCSPADTPASVAAGVTVVMPLRGHRHGTRANWQALLACDWEGPLEVLFVVDSHQDPAAAAVQQLLQDMSCEQQPAAATQPSRQPTDWGADAATVQLPPAGLLGCWRFSRSSTAACEPQANSQQQQQQQLQRQQQQSATASSSSSSQQQGGPPVGPQAAPDPSGSWRAAAGQLTIKLLEAGPATCCSQKIQNQLAGLGAADQGTSKYVLFLDDDVLLHPASIRDLVAALEHTSCSSSSSSSSGSSRGRSSSSSSSSSRNNGSMSCKCSGCQATSPRKRPFMATGYPFDVPAAGGSSLLAYATLVYHLPLLIGFSVAPTTPFVWGGCMLMRLADMLQPDSLAKVWYHGGYSDDLLAAGYCASKGHTIAVPSTALFPQVLQPSYTLPQYWNYLRRQLFVLDTYQGRQDRHLNHQLMVVHACCSAAVAGSCLAAAVHLAAVAVVLAGRYLAAAPPPWGTLGKVVSISAAASSPRQQNQDVGGGGGWLAAEPLCGLDLQLQWGVVTFLAVAAAAQASIWWMTQQVLLLWRVVAPQAPQHVLQPRISWLLLWAGLLLESLLLPPCMLYTYCCSSISWAGIKYRKRGGLVSVVQ